MDHRKIEWLFLILFLLVDIYLFVELWQAPVTLTSSTTSTTSTANLKSEMKSDNITLPKLSKQSGSGYYLASKNKSDLKEKAKTLSSDLTTSYSDSDNILYGTLKTPIALERMTVKNFKNDTNYVLHSKDYVYDSSLSNSSTYVYLQKTKFGTLYSGAGQLVINVRDKAITGYYQTYLNDLTSVRELQATISPWRAVSNLYTTRELTSNSKVMWVKPAYTRLTKVKGNVIFVPTWLVLIENKRSKSTALKRINAFSGQLMQTNAINE